MNALSGYPFSGDDTSDRVSTSSLSCIVCNMGSNASSQEQGHSSKRFATTTPPTIQENESPKSMLAIHPAEPLIPLRLIDTEPRVSLGLANTS